MITETLKRKLAARHAESELLERGASPMERREMDNLFADIERESAILEYIAACDYPEIFEEEEVGNE